MAGSGASGLASLRERIRAAAALLGADDALLPTYGGSEQTGRPHIEADADGVHYVVCERGTEFERSTSNDLDEIAYLACRDIAFEMACAREVQGGQDSRRRIFALEAELLRRVDPGWSERVKAENELILAEYPFEDEETS